MGHVYFWNGQKSYSKKCVFAPNETDKATIWVDIQEDLYFD